MAATRPGRQVGSGRIDTARFDAMTDAERRRILVEDGLDPDNPLAGFRRVISPVEVRRKTALSQDGFANNLGIPVKTIQNWEQGVSSPDPAARALLALVADDPERAFRVLRPGTLTAGKAEDARHALDDRVVDASKLKAHRSA